MNVPKLRFKDINNPHEKKRIGEIFAERSERGNPTAELLSVTMNDGIKKRNEIEGKDNSSEDKSNYKSVYKDDIVYNSMRMWQGANGVSKWNGIVSPAYTVLKPKKDICIDFFGYYFKTYNLIHRFKVFSQGMTSDTWNLKYPQISEITVFVPPLPEQQKIADFLSLVDTKIENQQSIVESLDNQKKGFMQKLFNQELRFKDENGKNYPDWEEKTLADVTSGFQYGMNAAAIQFDGENKYIRITDIDDNTGRFVETNLSSPSGELSLDYLVKKGDILFARTGASTGKTYLYRPSDGKLYFAGFLIRCHVKSPNNPYFIYSITLSSDYNKWIKVMSMRSGQPGINAKEYASYSFICPSQEEQNRIADFLSTFDDKIEAEKQILASWQIIKKGLLQQMFV